MRLPKYVFVFTVCVFAASLQTFAQQKTVSDGTHQYNILRKPKPTYTDEARTKNVEGTVRLKVVLLASGKVGLITPLKTKGWQRLKKYGLTQQAINAAREIEFTPKLVNGVPVNVIVTVEYEFVIY